MLDSIMKRRALDKAISILFLLFAVPLLCQTNQGELRLSVIDPAGLGVKTTVLIVSRANNIEMLLRPAIRDTLDVQHLPFGIYELEIEQLGFAAQSESVEIRSILAYLR